MVLNIRTASASSLLNICEWNEASSFLANASFRKNFSKLA
jgi:hypothetical protein